MKVYSGEGLGSFYYELIRDITNHGRRITTRGHDCLEMPEPVLFVYEKPGHCWMRTPGRKFNPFFALAEIVWILMGSGDVEWISYFNSNMRRFADKDQPNFHGAYGLRMRKWGNDYPLYLADVEASSLELIGKESAPIDQIQHVVRKLREDPNSRQAVISMWDPVRDNLDKSADYPCNDLVIFSLREDVLDMTVVIRSNDVIWGTPYNAIQFSHLLSYVAGSRMVKMGKIYYFVQNLHYYFDLYKKTLATVLERAFSDDHAPKLKAEVIPNFDVVSPEEFTKTLANISYIFRNYRDIKIPLPVTQVRFTGGGYWNHTIPMMIWLYTVIKSGRVSDANDLDFLAERVVSLGEPLTSLILDFYEESQNQLAREVLHSCRRTLLPSSASSV